jgi:hypothetical protein
MIVLLTMLSTDLQDVDMQNDRQHEVWQEEAEEEENEDELWNAAQRRIEQAQEEMRLIRNRKKGSPAFASPASSISSQSLNRSSSILRSESSTGSSLASAEQVGLDTCSLNLYVYMRNGMNINRHRHLFELTSTEISSYRAGHIVVVTYALFWLCYVVG